MAGGGTGKRSRVRLAVLVFLLALGPIPVAAGIGSEEAEPPAAGEPGAPAPWLVTVDGQRIELAEPWRRQGSRVLFRTQAGTLSAIRAEEIDFDASRVPEPEAPAPVTEEAEVEAVLVLENGALPTEGTAQESGEQSAEAEAAAADETSPAPTQIADAPPPPATARSGGAEEAAEVTAWTDVSETGDNVILYGTLRNNRGLPLDRVRLRVDLLDETGEVLMSAPARLARRQVPARGTVNFQAYFDAFVPYSDVDFVIEGTS